MPAEKLRSGMLGVLEQALFPRYLFIRLGHGPTAQSWNPIRSTKGVSRLVTFDTTPAKVGYLDNTSADSRGNGSG